MNIGLSAVKPGVQGAKAVYQARGHPAVVGFPVFEFGIVQGRQKELPVDPLPDQLFHGLPDDLPEPVLVLFLCVFCDNGKIGLPDPLIIASEDVLSDTGLQQGLLQGSSGHIQEQELQDLPGNVKLRIQLSSRYEVGGEVAAAGEVLIVPQGIPDPFLPGCCKSLLEADLRGHLPAVVGIKIVFLKPQKLILHIHVSIEVDIGIGGVVIGPVELQEVLIGQLRNMVRISPGLHPVHRIREQGVHGIALQHRLRIGEGPLHLVVYHSVIRELSLRGDLIMPAFLLKDPLFMVDVWMEHRIHVYVHQIRKVPVVAGSHGIDGLVRIGHGIQEGVEGSLGKLHERILQGKTFGAAENGVLQNMGHSRIVLRCCTESDIKHLVLILIFDGEDPGTGLFVLVYGGCAAAFRDLPLLKERVICIQIFHLLMTCLS